jgi:hypothetical protein
MGTAYRKRTWTATGSVHIVCIRFPLQVVHQFELLRLSDMSNRLFVVVSTLLVNGIMFINELMVLFYINTCIAIFIWLSSRLPCLKSN